jgi:dTDP-4-dehydrorhamnose 3,5-epimerase-like enzyme
MLIVPPGVYHGWMSLEDDTQLISIASHTYNASSPDEERVSYDSFGYDWSINFK